MVTGRVVVSSLNGTKQYSVTFAGLVSWHTVQAHLFAKLVRNWPALNRPHVPHSATAK